MTITIYGSLISPFVRKTIAFCGEKGLEFDVKGVAIGDPDPGFRAASPLGKMPAMADGDFTLADSSAIIHYLEAKHPAPNLIPAEPELRGRTIWWDEFGDTVLAACGGKMFFNRIVAPKFLGRAGDMAAADVAEREELPKLLAYLESAIPASGFLVDDRLTLADLAVATSVVNLGHLGIRIDADIYPRAATWSAAILARPSFAPWIAKEERFLART